MPNNNRLLEPSPPVPPKKIPNYLHYKTQCFVVVGKLCMDGAYSGRRENYITPGPYCKCKSRCNYLINTKFKGWIMHCKMAISAIFKISYLIREISAWNFQHLFLSLYSFSWSKYKHNEMFYFVKIVCQKY